MQTIRYQGEIWELIEAWSEGREDDPHTQIGKMIFGKRSRYHGYGRVMIVKWDHFKERKLTQVSFDTQFAISEQEVKMILEFLTKQVIEIGA